ncbi:porin, partial [Stappia indica]
MNIKSILLGASAAALAATGAQAADLPVAPEPVDYVRVCDAFGT